MVNMRWPNDRKRIWLVPKQINRTRPAKLVLRAKSWAANAMVLQSIINGRLKTRFKNSFVRCIDHEISGNKHQARKQNIPLTSFTASKADTPWLKALQHKKIFSPWPGRLWIGARVSQLNAERNWKLQDWGDDQAEDHLLCANSGEYYGIISPGLQMELYL